MNNVSMSGHSGVNFSIKVERDKLAVLAAQKAAETAEMEKMKEAQKMYESQSSNQKLKASYSVKKI